LGEKFDVLVSNPPYIESDEIKNLQTEVSVYEPRLALDGGVDGLDYYKPIVELFKKICEENGVLAVEIGRQQKESVEEIFLNSKVFKEVKAYRDLAGNDRVIIGMT